MCIYFFFSFYSSLLRLSLRRVALSNLLRISVPLLLTLSLLLLILLFLSLLLLMLLLQLYLRSNLRYEASRLPQRGLLKPHFVFLPNKKESRFKSPAMRNGSGIVVH